MAAGVLAQFAELPVSDLAPALTCVGVDINPQPNYPEHLDFYQGDALGFSLPALRCIVAV